MLKKLLSFFRKKKDVLGPVQREWVEYLKAHPEEQIKGQLGEINNGVKGYCCLGIGGLIAGVCEWNLNDQLCLIKSNSITFLNYNTYKSLGLIGHSGQNIHRTKDTLAVLNDGGSSWTEIANLLENHPEEYFTHKV